MLVNILSYLRIVMEMNVYDSRVDATRGKRVEGSGGRRKGGQESSRHHSRLGGVPHNKNIWRRKVKAAS